MNLYFNLKVRADYLKDFFCNDDCWWSVWFNLSQESLLCLILYAIVELDIGIVIAIYAYGAGKIRD